MQKILENPCVRCGKPRKVVKTWSEKIGTSKVKYTLAVCPDSECQKIVDATNAEREEKRLSHLNRLQVKKAPHR